MNLNKCVELWFLLGIFSLLWGSFLNVVAYRLINNQSIVRPRSRCPHCKTPIAWYDNIPVFSWLLLRAKCRHCKESISILYPLIELFTVISFLALYYFEPTNFIAYAVLFSALIVTIRTDLEYMLISRMVTIALIPVAWLFSYFGLLPITLYQSILGALIGFLSLYLIARIFYFVTKKEGIGEGDFDLLALVGAFTGAQGAFFTLLLGSWIGTIIGIVYLLISGKGTQAKIPFGPFLALGAMSYVLWHDILMSLLIRITL